MSELTPVPGTRVLLVEDEPNMARTLAKILERKGYDVATAGNGEEALRELAAGAFAVIVTDLNMPVLDGIGFLKEIKKHPSYKFTPVIMLTTEAGEDKKAEGRAAGAKAWIVKPFQPQTMLDAVAKLCLA